CVHSTYSDYEFSNGSIKIHGKSLINLTYVNSQNCLLSNIFEEEFEKSFDVSSGDDFLFAAIGLTTKYSNYRLINQRRIDVHSVLNAKICVYLKRELNCLSKCENAFVRNYSSDFLSSRGGGVCSAEFEETFSSSNNNTQINNIVNCFANCVIEDKKMVKDKLLFKLRIDVSVLYQTESNAIEKSIHSFSSSKIIDVSNTNENDVVFASAKLCNIYIKPKANVSNILSDIEIVGRTVINYHIMGTDSQSYIVDSYIPHQNTKLSLEKTTMRISPLYYFDDKTVEQEFQLDKSIVDLLDLNAQIDGCIIEKSAIHIYLRLEILYYDDSSQLCSYDEIKELGISLNDTEYDGDGSAVLKSYDFVIKNTNQISLRMNIEYSAYLYTTKEIQFLTDMESLGEDDDVNSPELTLYFAHQGENIWDIAKSFSTSSDLIMEENEISSQVIEDSRILLVPGM
ncbi:MAG: DUF3794 domain-containing protein, partial [Clostridiales bacterium]|nr:DUF3794 domain-containing protein [Clostridiales bacterium]